MKKLVYLIVALGIVSLGLLTGCQQKTEPNTDTMQPSTNAAATNATETPSTNEAEQ